MEKTTLSEQFASRLRDAMLAAGLYSQRSTSGVCIHKLAEITGHSVQICRRYLRGEAIPEPGKLVEIACKLKVSPGWLLFGDHGKLDSNNQEKLIINKNLLQYIFKRALVLYNSSPRQNEIPVFLTDLIGDLSLIDTSQEQSQKIVDLALSSVNFFHES